MQVGLGRSQPAKGPAVHRRHPASFACAVSTQQHSIRLCGMPPAQLVTWLCESVRHKLRLHRNVSNAPSPWEKEKKSAENSRRPGKKKRRTSYAQSCPSFRSGCADAHDTPESRPTWSSFAHGAALRKSKRNGNLQAYLRRKECGCLAILTKKRPPAPPTRGLAHAAIRLQQQKTEKMLDRSLQLAVTMIQPRDRRKKRSCR